MKVRREEVIQQIILLTSSLGEYNILVVIAYYVEVKWQILIYMNLIVD